MACKAAPFTVLWNSASVWKGGTRNLSHQLILISSVGIDEETSSWV